MKLQNISEYKTYQQQTFQTTKHIKLQNISDYKTYQQQTFQTTKRINNVSIDIFLYHDMF